MSSVNEMSQKAAERAAARNKLKEAYQKIYNNPFRTNSQIYDPAVFRYEAARAYAKEFYKMTPRSLAIPLGLAAFTIWFQGVLNKEKGDKVASIQTGETSYYERSKWGAKVIY